MVKDENAIISMMIMEVFLASPELMRRARRIHGANAHPTTNRVRGGIRANIFDIDTRDKLANIVYKNFGCGIFNILFFTHRRKNKRYNPFFQCDKCIKLEKTGIRCKDLKSPEGGMVCKRNRKYISSWKVRAMIKIILGEDAYTPEKEYTYHWITRIGNLHRDYMTSFFWWKGNRESFEKRKERRLMEEALGEDIDDTEREPIF